VRSKGVVLCLLADLICFADGAWWQAPGLGALFLDVARVADPGAEESVQPDPCIHRAQEREQCADRPPQGADTSAPHGRPRTSRAEPPPRRGRAIAPRASVESTRS
jgi:hypothetical protein